MLVFLDIETTGNLDRGPGAESILEVALLVADDDLNVRGGFQQLVQPIHLHVENMDPFVRDMHTKNGLLKDIEAEAALCYAKGQPGIRRYEAEAKILKYLEQFDAEWPADGAQMVGNSVWFDYIFINEHMPLLAEKFSRRVIDLTAINQLAERWATATWEARPRPNEQHRAMGDCWAAVDLLRHYSGSFLPNACKKGELFNVNPSWKKL